MKTFASVLACAAWLVAAPAFSAPNPEPQSPIVLAGAVCVGPACVGGRRAYDEDWRWRERHPGYGYDHGCRDVTVRKRTPDGDFVTKHIRRCD